MDKLSVNMNNNYVIIKIIEMLKTTGLLIAKTPHPSQTTSGHCTHTPFSGIGPIFSSWPQPQNTAQFLAPIFATHKTPQTFKCPQSCLPQVA